MVGFFVSGHPLNRFAAEAAVLGTHTTADLGRWMEGQLAVAAVVTAVKRQIARRSGAEWARLVVEDFHGAAEVIVFPEAWAKLSKVIVPDGAFLLLGGYSPRDRNEEEARLVVEDAQPLADIAASGRLAVALRWRGDAAPPADAARAVAALCRAHPGPAPLLLEWSGGGQRWPGAVPLAEPARVPGRGSARGAARPARRGCREPGESEVTTWPPTPWSSRSPSRSSSGRSTS